MNSQQWGRKGEKKKEWRRISGEGFRFPDIGDLCRVQINYSGQQHNHTETQAILHKLHSHEVDPTVFHKIGKSVN